MWAVQSYDLRYQLAGLLDHLPAQALPQDLGGDYDDEQQDLSVETLKLKEVEVLEHIEHIKQL